MVRLSFCNMLRQLSRSNIPRSLSYEVIFYTCPYFLLTFLRIAIYPLSSPTKSAATRPNFFLQSCHIRVDLQSYESKPTDKWEQYDWRADKNLDGYKRRVQLDGFKKLDRYLESTSLLTNKKPLHCTHVLLVLQKFGCATKRCIRVYLGK